MLKFSVKNLKENTLIKYTYIQKIRFHKTDPTNNVDSKL